MIRFAICDDEPYMLEELSNRLTDYMKKRQISSYQITCYLDGQSLLESDLNFDLLFLDIQMAKPDGMEVARRLRRLGNQCLLIFVTVLKEYVFCAFEVEAYDYLVKPLAERPFQKTMKRALLSLRQHAKQNLLIQRGNSCQVILLSQILYCEVLGRKIYVHQTDGTVLDYYDRLEHLEQQTDGRFFRCHRSYLVNLDYVRGCQKGQVFLPKDMGKPVVFIDCGEGEYDNVGIADYEGGKEMTEFILKQGHRKIAFFCDRKNPISSTFERFRGYCDALEGYGIKYNSEDYYYLPDERNLRREAIRNFALQAKQEGYTAVFVVSDLLANETVNRFFEEGLSVPEDISVAGFDDNLYARMSRPMLTTIRQSVEEKGEEAVKLLMQRIRGEEVIATSFKLPVELIVRESVKNINSPHI